MEEEHAIQRDKCNISVLVPDCHKKFYNLIKIMEIIGCMEINVSLISYFM